MKPMIFPIKTLQRMSGRESSAKGIDKVQKMRLRMDLWYYDVMLA
jgi:hypothetical protein